MPRQLALFDLDNTLLNRVDAFARWAAGFCATHGIALEEVPWLVEADLDGYCDRRDFFHRVAARYGLTSSVDHLLAAYGEDYPVSYLLDDRVAAGLAALRADGWALAIVSNGDGETQRRKIELTGLAALVDGWCISGDEGFRKPDPRIVALAAERAGASLTADAWLVGDNLEADIGAARNAGVRAIWIARNGSPEGGPGVAHVVPDVLAAFAILRTASLAQRPLD